MTDILACPRCHLRFLNVFELRAHLDEDHPQPLPFAPAPSTAGRVVVPIDPDHGVPVALEVARRLAEQARLAIDLVASPSIANHDEAEAFLRDRAGRIRAEGEHHVEWHLLAADVPTTEILRHVGETGADLVCMATRSIHGPRHLLFGSVAEAVVLGAEVPVLLVGPHVAQASERYRTVVACVDGSAEATNALHFADRMRRAIGAELVLIEVVEPQDDIRPDAAESGLLVRLAHSMDVPPAGYDVLHRKHPVEAIAEFVNALDDVIVVTGTHDRTGTRFVLSKSVARGVAGASHHPTLVVPPSAAPDHFLGHDDTRTTA